MMMHKAETLIKLQDTGKHSPVFLLSKGGDDWFNENIEKPFETFIHFNEQALNLCHELDGIPNEVFSKNRNRPHVQIRQVIHYVMRKRNPGDSLDEIGRVSGHDHSTVLHSIKVVNNAIETNDELYLKYLKKIKI
jgi:chromosomal replication initiation ATPase DnaA